MGAEHGFRDTSLCACAARDGMQAITSADPDVDTVSADTESPSTAGAVSTFVPGTDVDTGSTVLPRFRIVALFVAVGAQAGFVVGPARFDLDPDLQVDRAAEQALHVQARLAGHFFQPGALVTDDHGLVAVAFDEDGGEDAAQVAFLFEFLDQHRAGVRQFVADEAEQLFTDDFRGEEFLAAVGDVVLAEDG